MTDRRAFLKTSALAAAATPLGAAETGGCQLAIGTYGLQSMPLAAAIRLIAEIGYDALEITSFEGMTGSPEALAGKETRTEIRNLIADSGIPLGALMVNLQPQKDDAAHREQIDTLRSLIELAHDLSPDKPPILQTVLGGKNWDESKHLFRDRIADWNQMAADQKIVISIKPHRSHAMGTPEQAVWLIEQLGNPRRLKMVYDYSHYSFHEPPLSIEETVKTALPITNYVAVKDAVEKDGKVVFALAGESDSWDHADIIRAFYEGGYRGEFCCEVSSQIWKKDPKYDPVAATKTCYENMVAAIERAGVPRN